jgi:hypothetical protein
MLLEFSEFLRQDIGIWYNVKGSSSEFLLHLGHVKAQSILSSHLIRLGEVVNSLVLIHSFIKKGFTRGRRPQDIPLMTFSVG